mgnify:CR=1 FL=1
MRWESSYFWGRDDFSQKLKAKRLQMGFKTQKEFAEAMVVKYQTYHGWERGYGVPSYWNLFKLVDFLLKN